MNSVAVKEQEGYTYADWLTWPEGYHAELIDGVLYEMKEVWGMAAPSDYHQSIVGEIFFQFKLFLRGKSGVVMISPYDVRLFPQPDESDETVVEPDVVVILDQSQRDRRGCNGAPDLVVEVLSPYNPQHDTVLKMGLYLDAGVTEYWTVDPDTKTVHQHLYRAA